MKNDERKELPLTPILWQGDLLDDCTAEWAGLTLRAEEMEQGSWWWAVYDFQREEITIGSSNNYNTPSESGEQARAFAEAIAREYIARVIKHTVAQFFIKESFIITGRGLVVLGHIINGTVSAGNLIELSTGSEFAFKKIIGIEEARTLSPFNNLGLRIECEDQTEAEYLKQDIIKNHACKVFLY